MKRIGRRTFLGWLPGAALLVSGFSIPRDIEWMGDEYRMLKDAALRRSRMGDKTLKVKSAIFTGGGFHEAEWENVHFENCTFYGRTQLKNLKNAVFERCSFIDANFQSYYMENVYFQNCKTKNKTYIMSGRSSREVVFEACNFQGSSLDPNNFGSIFIHNVVYKNCVGRYTDISGINKVFYNNCNFQDVEMKCGDYDIPAKQYIYANVTIENSFFKNLINMKISSLSGLVIRKCEFDFLDLTNVDCNGNILIENIKAGAMLGAFKKLRNITIRNSRFTGEKNLSIIACAYSIVSVAVTVCKLCT